MKELERLILTYTLAEAFLVAIGIVIIVGILIYMGDE